MQLLKLRYKGEPLTDPELDVLKRLALGDTQVQAAARLGKSLETVRSHSKMIRAKLDARTNAQAVGIAVSLDLI